MRSSRSRGRQVPQSDPAPSGALAGKRSLLTELKRRNVLRAAAFFAAAGWLLVQVATQVFPFYDLPDWTVRLVIAAVLIAFPFAMAFAWFYEWTPDGFRREAEVAPSRSIARQTGRRLDRWVIAILALAVAVLIADKLVLRHDAGIAAVESIAVLPLVNASGDPENQYFSDGVSEELISTLAQNRELKVIGRSSSFQFRDKATDARTIGEQLGVATLLEGSVRRQGNRVRIVASLVNAVDGRTLWSQSYDRELSDIFAVQTEIAQAVAGALQVALLDKPLAPKARPSNLDLEAYKALQQGNFHLQRNTADGHRKAIGYYEAAIGLDPNYALAHAKLADAWAFAGAQFGDSKQAVDDAYARARIAANTALKLDPTLAEAHAVLGWILLSADYDWRGAETHFRRAVALSPDDAMPKRRLAELLASIGRIDEAVALSRETVVLDPLDLQNHLNLVRYLVALGDREALDEAEQVMHTAAELQPSGSFVHISQAFIEILRGNADAALRAARQEPEGVWRTYALALARQIGSDRAAADTALDTLVQAHAGIAPFQIATVHALRKDPQQAFAWLERAWEARDPGISTLLFDPFLRPYRSDPRFAALCRKAGLPVPTVDTANMATH